MESHFSTLGWPVGPKWGSIAKKVQLVLLWGGGWDRTTSNLAAQHEYPSWALGHIKACPTRGFAGHAHAMTDELVKPNKRVDFLQVRSIGRMSRHLLCNSNTCHIHNAWYRYTYTIKERTYSYALPSSGRLEPPIQMRAENLPKMLRERNAEREMPRERCRQ